jgi:hypothetical protein
MTTAPAVPRRTDNARAAPCFVGRKPRPHEIRRLELEVQTYLVVHVALELAPA